MPHFETDVLVAGGGPSGCMVARELSRRGYGVVVVSRDGASAGQRGETLPPRGVSFLSSLGIGTELTSGRIANVRLTSAWGNSSLAATDYSFHPYGAWWHLDRVAFDRELQRSASSLGAAFVSGRVVGTRQGMDEGTRWAIDVDTKAETRTYSARFLVDATGRTGAVARRLGAIQLRLDKLVSLVRVFEHSGREEPVLLTESVECGWWYSISLPDGRVAMALNSDSDVAPRRREDRDSFWSYAIRNAPHTFELSRACGSDASGVVVSTAHTALLRSGIGRRWLAVGDAYASRDPLSSSGILHALESGHLAGVAIAADLSGDETALQRYAAVVKEDFSRYMQHRWVQYYREQRWQTAVFWSRRHHGPVTNFLEGQERCS